MDSFSFHNIQAEKADAILKYRPFGKIASLLRFVEVCVVLVLISILSIQLPVAFNNSSEYFRDFSVSVVSPGFVFLVGNLIVITLFTLSGQFSAQGSRTKSTEADFYHEFIQNSTKNPGKSSIRTEDSIKSRRIGEDLTKYPEKQRINPKTIEDYRTKSKRIYGGQIKWEEKQSIKTGDTNSSFEVKDYRRCQTEILSCVNREKPRRVLHRCETENGRKSIQPSPAEKVSKTSYPEDDLSNDEFRRKVEAFIARQQRLRREEACSIV